MPATVQPRCVLVADFIDEYLRRHALRIRRPVQTFYVTGGTMSPDSPSYIARRADDELFEALEAGEFSYVLTSRQMGKSSLMVRTARRLENACFRTAVLDLPRIGSNVTVEQWYLGLATVLASHLDLEDEVEKYWDGSARLGFLLAAADGSAHSDHPHAADRPAAGDLH